jgi:hypothetical protein
VLAAGPGEKLTYFGAKYYEGEETCGDVAAVCLDIPELGARTVYYKASDLKYTSPETCSNLREVCRYDQELQDDNDVCCGDSDTVSCEPDPILGIGLGRCVEEKRTEIISCKNSPIIGDRDVGNLCEKGNCIDSYTLNLQKGEIESLVVQFDAYQIPDQLTVWVDGEVAFKTGYIGTASEGNIENDLAECRISSDQFDPAYPDGCFGSENVEPCPQSATTSAKTLRVSEASSVVFQVFGPCKGTGYTLKIECSEA